MSGGSRNYICNKIDDYLCGQMYDEELNDLMKDICQLAHDVEWYDSADFGEEEYFASVRKFKKKWFLTERNVRLIDYVDNRLMEIKKELYNLIGAEEAEVEK